MTKLGFAIISYLPCQNFIFAFVIKRKISEVSRICLPPDGIESLN